MIGYVTIGTNDLERACAFYDELFAVVGAKRLLELKLDQRGMTHYGVSMKRPLVSITRPYNGEPADPGNGNMIALVMDSNEQVDAFHAKALELGATNEGDPGLRGDPKFGWYFGYFRDLDGNKFAAFHLSPQS